MALITHCAECNVTYCIRRQGARAAHCTNYHVLTATLVLNDGSIKLIRRNLGHAFVCACGRELDTKQGLRQHVRRFCTLAEDVKFSDSESPAQQQRQHSSPLLSPSPSSVLSPPPQQQHQPEQQQAREQQLELQQPEQQQPEQQQPEQQQPEQQQLELQQLEHQHLNMLFAVFIVLCLLWLWRFAFCSCSYHFTLEIKVN